ncbi:hypothetical protein [Algoriella sp.]|uniref:hypothetical protein n=1 Tax=Algoriella sp. TaxID=1872434 RepID=UPI001B188378|nr:hypothetical protein [Algoriella sp.]MBO6212548.1 hypothetical protein [Algoriella sp.]
MKKFFAVVAVATLSLGAVSCGEKTEEAPVEAQAVDSAVAVVDSAAAVVDSAAATVDSAAAVVDSAAVAK